MFDIDSFISEYITGRTKSMFWDDLKENRKRLSDKIRGKSVLVIGGAGSIGSSFIKALLPFEPGALVVVDINENAIAELTRDLRSSKDIPLPNDYVTYPLDYASNTFEKMFRNRKGFDIVANFSAHKHVRSEKDIFSVEALIRNNIINAVRLLELLKQFPPEEYFCVSTDKAANPVNIMGASKRIMEDLIFSYSECFPVKTARFANVAFSNGSLPDGFLRRLEKRQPLSAPSDVKRYFVSPAESGQICMLACFLGENREIFFPKLKDEQMMSFDRIAVNLLREYGYTAHECSSDEEALEYAEQMSDECKEYPVHFSVSDTSGEKAYEEFYVSSEKTDLCRFKSLGVVVDKSAADKAAINHLIEKLNTLFDKDSVSKEDVVTVLKEYLPNFNHIETGKSLDSKM